MFVEKAIEKLEREFEEAKKEGLGRHESIVAKPVKEQLKAFCVQEEEFAQAIVQSQKTLASCLKYIMRDVGGGCSDLKVYERAVKFYFKPATIKMEMKINLCGDVEKEEKSNIISLSFDDLFD